MAFISFVKKLALDIEKWIKKTSHFQEFLVMIMVRNRKKVVESIKKKVTIELIEFDTQQLSSILRNTSCNGCPFVDD